MTVRANKPAFNIREKLKQLDFFRLPFQKMPPGSIVQIATASAGPARQTIGSPSTTPQVINGLSVDFTPRLASSKILIVCSVSSSQTYVSSYSVYEDGSPTVSSSGYTNLSVPNSNVTTYDGANTTNTEHIYQVTFQVPIMANGTHTRTYDCRAICRWNGTTYTLFINNRGSDDMASFSTMTIYEIAQ